jgi:hypothetical protein
MLAGLSPWSLYKFELEVYYCKLSFTSLTVDIPLKPSERPIPLEKARVCFTMIDVNGTPTRQYTQAVNRLATPDSAWEMAERIFTAFQERH